MLKAWSHSQAHVWVAGMTILLPYRYIVQTTTNEAYKVVRKETECEESDAESTEPSYINKATVAQESDDISHASYVNVNPTQLHYVEDDTRLSNVYVESGMEATDPTDLNKATITQDADDTSHASYVNVNPTQLHFANDDRRLSNVSDESGTDPTDLNKAAIAQDADDTTYTSYVNVNPTQMHYLDDDTHSSNVSIESGLEATDPTYMNINATVAQGATTTTHTSYVNIAQFGKMKKKM